MFYVEHVTLIMSCWFISRSWIFTWTTPPFQLIQKLRNSSQESIPGVEALTRGSPIFPMEIQERVFCLPPSTISNISALSWGLADRAKWASLCVFTATWNWFILAGFFTYWYSYLFGVDMWILSDWKKKILSYFKIVKYVLINNQLAQWFSICGAGPTGEESSSCIYLFELCVIWYDWLWFIFKYAVTWW